ncbi:MAG: hypothetical protein IJ198_10115 [Lachnospiraceae bacterium]|nr:hypothetical protein [Lachnospiraceae bacterium]
MDENRGTDFTIRAWDVLHNAVSSKYFLDRDADLIYAALQKNLKYISFGEYLKRYIYRQACLEEPFEEVPLKEYQQIIKGAFSDNNTPQSFDPTSASLTVLSKRWLTQQTVRRKVVFLLGFGLGMSVEDVNEFLTKGLREQGINAKNPFEVICWYCYKNEFGYPTFERLWRTFNESSPNELDAKLLYSDFTVGARNTMRAINSEEALMAFVSKLKTDDNTPQHSVTAKKCFDELYTRAREIVADIYNTYEEDKQGKGPKRHYTIDDITESDLEHVISSAIPLDRHGNLTPVKASKLNAQFAGKRFSRQHTGEILAGNTEVTRFDLITLNFFIYSQTLDDYPSVKERYNSFVESTNEILKRCFLGELYISNPYECFVLMCILSEDPLGTYADVWEMSYEQ